MNHTQESQKVPHKARSQEPRLFTRTLKKLFDRFEQATPPFPEREPTMPPKSLLKFTYHYSHGMKKMLLLMTTLTTAIAILEVSLYGFFGSLVDELATKDPATFFEQEWVTLVQMAGLILFVIPFLILIHSTTVHQGVLGNLPMSIRWSAHRYLLKQSMEFYQNEFAGRVATKVMQTALATREVITKVLDILVFISVYFASMLVIIAQFHILLMLPMLMWLLCYCLIQCYFVPKLRHISQQQANARADMTGRIVDSYTNIHTVKLFAHTESEASYAKESMSGFLDTVYKQMRLVTGINFSIQALNYLLLFTVTIIGLWLWRNGDVTVGAVAVVIPLALRLNGLSQWIMWEISNLFENIGTVVDGANTLSKPLTVKDRPQAQRLEQVQGAVSFKRVHFNYQTNISVFNNLNIEIKPGERIGLVGRSGAGKSTFVNLLLRLHDIDQGSICIDGRDIAELSQDGLRAQIGMVTQDTSLLHRTIRENILYGNPEATDEQMVQAAKKAEAHEFILTLSDKQGRTGYDVQVGERGVKLSGGQRQRVAIARVLLKNAPILILDEATSALDSEVESAIQSNLHYLIEGKTVIAIAHRLSTISAMDRLIVLDKGKIVDQGTHSELVNRQGLYAQLWNLQSGGFIYEGGDEKENKGDKKGENERADN